MTVPDTLISPTLASLYAKQGHASSAIAVIHALDLRQRARKSEILTELLQRVNIHRTEREPHGLQGKSHRDY